MRRSLAVGVFMAWVAAATAIQVDAQDRTIRLLPTTPITTTGGTSDYFTVPLGARVITMQARFVYGSGGTTAKAYVQTTFDHGATWVDVAAFAFTTASATKVSSVRGQTAVAAAYIPTDGTLADDTIKDGLIGERLRVKYITAGTYAATTLAVTGRVD